MLPTNLSSDHGCQILIHCNSASWWLGLAELVLNFNNFSFDDEHYQQISGVAMGAKMVIMLIIIIIMLICLFVFVGK
jgi:hypothetical protein